MNDHSLIKRKRRRHLLLLLLPVAFAIIPLVRYLTRDVVQPQIPPASVVVATPVRGTVRDSLTYSGILEPKSTVGVIPKIAGEVAGIAVEAGDTVSPGDLLLTLDDERVALQAQTARSAWEAAQAQYELALRGPREEELANARASLAQAERDIALAQRNLERTERLFDAGTVSQSELEEAQSRVESARTEFENSRRLVRLMEEGASAEELEAARANAEAARRQYELAVIQREDARVIAPVAGTVARVLVEEGDTVAPGRPVASIINASILTAAVSVPERYYGRIRRAAGDLAVAVRPIAYEEGLSFDARLLQIEPTVDPASRTFTVEIAVDNSDGLLLPGMYSTVELVVDTVTDALLVPRSAVIERNGSSVVFVVEEGVPTAETRMVRVELGLAEGDLIHVRSGLAEDALVVVEGNAFLEGDQPVLVAGR